MIFSLCPIFLFARKMRIFSRTGTVPLFSITHEDDIMKKTTVSLALCAALLLAGSNTVLAAGTWDSISRGISDAAESTAQAAEDLAVKATGLVDDSTITGVVKGKLAFRKGLEGADISVSTTKGIVTLTGLVHNAAQSILAEKIAEEVNGVKGVANKLTIAGGAQSGGVIGYLDDAGITAGVKGRFLSQEGLDSTAITVTTESGVVTLAGHVGNSAQIGLAERVAMEGNGVKAVVNRLSVAPGQSGASSTKSSVGEFFDDSALTAAVKSRLIAQKGIDSLDISVKTEAGVVTLTGNVENLAQAALAEYVARDVSGVKNVHNALVVK